MSDAHILERLVRIEDKIDRLLAIGLVGLKAEERIMTTQAEAFALMKSEVARTVTVDESIRALLKGTIAQLASAEAAIKAATPSVDTSEILALVDQLKTGTDGLVADVVANTPAAPAPAPTEPAPASPTEPPASPAA